jgi:hypothetical protein
MVDIYNTATGKRWELTIERDKIFNLTSLATVRLVEKLAQSERTDNRELTEEDRGLFNSYFSLAISDLVILLARYFSKEFTDNNIDGEYVYITMDMQSYHKASVAYSLEQYIIKYIELRCLQEWFGPESGPLGIDDSITLYDKKIHQARDYRKDSAKLPVDPIL